MPLPKNTHFAMKHTSKGNVRLAFNPKGDVIEAKNMKTGDTQMVKPTKAHTVINKKKGK